MSVSQVQLCGKQVRIDEEGMVSLTDMWKASGGKSNSKVNDFLRLDKTSDFIRVVEKAGNPAIRKIAGRRGGTWAHKLVAYKYASWIDPEFEVGVYTILDQFFSGELKPALSPYEELQILEQEIKVLELKGSFHGKGLATYQHEKSQKRQRALKLISQVQNTLFVD